ncbi:hypothetical protein PoB_007117400 [Plakobranchus ocellatus]|uniref:Uncharacterized protein n=1 Tax=Plakobranchus ocellatus TaxID=259542 RepID=A0AAV4DKV0_9GAST|nr:hypothetical protein PoB_007117400 [Plakobranchus ocellatus]
MRKTIDNFAKPNISCQNSSEEDADSDQSPIVWFSGLGGECISIDGKQTLGKPWASLELASVTIADNRHNLLRLTADTKRVFRVYKNWTPNLTRYQSAKPIFLE